MSDCSTCAGTVPVTPTRWSSGWFTCCWPNVRAASTSSAKLVPGWLKMYVSAVVPCSGEVKTSLTLTTGTAAAMGPTSPMVPFATPTARSTARSCAPTESPDSLRCTSTVRLRSGKPKVSAEARSVAMALLFGGAKPPRSACCVVAGSKSAAAATTAQPSTMGQRRATTHLAYNRPSEPASDERHDLIDPPFLPGRGVTATCVTQRWRREAGPRALSSYFLRPGSEVFLTHHHRGDRVLAAVLVPVATGRGEPDLSTLRDLLLQLGGGLVRTASVTRWQLDGAFGLHPRLEL